MGRRATRPSPSRTRPTSRSSPRPAATPLGRDRAGRSSRPAAAFDEGVWADLPAAERAARPARAPRPRRGGEGRPRGRDDDGRGRPAAGVRRGLAVRHGPGPRPGRRSTSTCRCATRSRTRSPSTSWSQGRVALSIRRHEPVGVVAAITPYNGAIIMAFQKLVPALLAGNSVVLRPSPLTPHLVARVRRRRRRRRHPARRAERGASRRAPPAPSCSPPTPPSTWCRSPAPPPSAGRSSPRPPRR